MSETEEFIQIKKSDFKDILYALEFCLRKIQQLHPEDFPLSKLGSLQHDDNIRRITEELEEEKQ